MSEENTKTFYHDCGKGDRPRGTGWKNYYNNWDAIFGKKEDVKILGGIAGPGMDTPPTLQVSEESGCSTNAGSPAIVEVIKADEG